jgi:hypothetical protein
VRSPVGWSIDRARRTERSWVTGEVRRLRAIAVGELLLFVVTIGAMLLWEMAPPSWLTIACGLLVGVQVGRAGIVSMRRAMAYRSGWLDGRSAFVHAMAEAQRRGMAPGDWLSAELARDYAVLGLEADGERLDPRDEL